MLGYELQPASTAARNLCLGVTVDSKGGPQLPSWQLRVLIGKYQ